MTKPPFFVSLAFRSRLGSLLGGFALLALMTACSKPAPSEEPVRAVKLTTVTLSAMQAGGEFSGEVRARVESRLGFRVGGKMIRRLVEQGQHVKAGQPLAELDPQDYKLADDAARAQLAAAVTNRDLAAADLKRFRDLRDQNFISAAELDRRDATLKAAQSQVDQAQAQVAAQGNQAAYTRLVADVAGVVTAVEAEAGQVVAAGTPVVRIAQDGPRDVLFSVPEDKVALIATGSSVQVQPWAGGAGMTGQVREVAAVADPVTRTFLVKVSLGAGALPALGTTVNVVPQALSRSAVQVIKLPTSALRQDGKASAVWVLDKASMTVRSQSVEVATADGNDAVITGGLQPGMEVVVAGVHVLSPGQKVSIFKENGSVTPANQGQGATPSVAAPASAAASPASGK